jgi:hypothetical protein
VKKQCLRCMSHPSSDRRSGPPGIARARPAVHHPSISSALLYPLRACVGTREVIDSSTLLVPTYPTIQTINHSRRRQASTPAPSQRCRCSDSRSALHYSVCSPCKVVDLQFSTHAKINGSHQMSPSHLRIVDPYCCCKATSQARPGPAGLPILDWGCAATVQGTNRWVIRHETC